MEAQRPRFDVIDGHRGADGDQLGWDQDDDAAAPRLHRGIALRVQDSVDDAAVWWEQRRHWLIPVGLLITVSLIGVGWWMDRRPIIIDVAHELPVAGTEAADSPSAGSQSASAPPQEATPVSPEPDSLSDAEPLATRPAATIVVHVAGAVHHPGVYSLDEGSRVADAVSAAGGAHPDADLNRINLASLIGDGAHIHVPERGADPPSLIPIETPVPGGMPEANGPPSAAHPAGPINVNTADAAVLETLPGVGPATAEAILAWREQHGQFHTIDQLLDVPGIGPSKFSRLEPLITVS